MIKDTVIRLAKEAGMHHLAWDADYIEGTARFSALVEKDVLGRVAETVDNLAKCYHDPVNSALKALAETIRGQHE